MGTDCCKKRKPNLVNHSEGIDVKMKNNIKNISILNIKGNKGPKNFEEKDNNNNLISYANDDDQNTNSREKFVKIEINKSNSTNKKIYEKFLKHSKNYQNILYNYLLLNEQINNSNKTNLKSLYIIKKEDNNDIIKLHNQVINNETYKGLNTNAVEEKKNIIKNVIEEFLAQRNQLNNNDIKVYKYEDLLKENLKDKEIDIIDDNFCKDMNIKIKDIHKTKCIELSDEMGCIIITLEYIDKNKKIKIEKKNAKYYLRHFLDEKESASDNHIKSSMNDFYFSETNSKQNKALKKINSINTEKITKNKEIKSDDKNISNINISENTKIVITPYDSTNNNICYMNNMKKNSNNMVEKNEIKEKIEKKEINEIKEKKEKDDVYNVFMILLLFKFQNDDIVPPSNDNSISNNNKYYYLINKDIIINIKNEISNKINEDINVLINTFLDEQRCDDFEEFYEKKEIVFEDFKKNNIYLFQKEYNFNIINNNNILPKNNEIINSINNNKIIVPTNFILIRTEIYELLKNFFKLENEANKNLIDNINKYSLLVFENQINLINNDENEKTIYICEISKINDEYQLEDINISYLLMYNLKENFSKEFHLFINNNGFNNYIVKRELKINTNKPQNIIDENKETIGYFINLKNNNDVFIETNNTDLINNIDNNIDSNSTNKNNNNNSIKENIDNNISENNDKKDSIIDNNNNLQDNNEDNNNNDTNNINSDENNTNDNNNNQTLQNSKLEEKEKIIIGLRNIRSNCYANSLLQCMYHITPLTQYFISNTELFNLEDNNINNKNSFSYKYYEVIYHLYYKKQNSKIIDAYSPTDFLDYIQNADPSSFIANKINDPKKLFYFIIQNLKKELNKKENIKNLENSSNIGISIQTNNDSLQLFKKFLNNFKFTNNSIIDNYFAGIKCNVITCQNCNEIDYSFKEFYSINFILSKIENSIGQNKKITLDKCFEFYYNKEKSIINDNSKNICKKCSKSVFSCYKQIYLSPKILVIIIDDVTKKGNLFKLKNEIDINDYLIEKNEGYQLIGLVTYFKEKGMNEQYISYCKSNIDGKWYCCYDDCIYEVKEPEPQNDMEGKNRQPYILFYIEKKN